MSAKVPPLHVDFLFFYVNDMTYLIKWNCDLDGFLFWLHVLVLMDDTVLLSTTRAGMIMKIQPLNQYCTTHGMKMNLGKTKFMVINGLASDKEPILVYNLTVEHCTATTAAPLSLTVPLPQP